MTVTQFQPTPLATVAALSTLAVLLDWWLGEPQRRHPLVGFGQLAQRVETRFHADNRWRGVGALLLLLLPAGTLSWWLTTRPGPLGQMLDALFSVWALYFALGHRSLHDHAQPIAAALHDGNEPLARAQTARIVSRDPATLDCIPATCESVLENGNDAVFGALFWFICAGAPGALVYRLANTLDGMWGYKTPRHMNFGWAAARFDDLLNWLPARLTALTYALLGNTRTALQCWRHQATAWESPNAGPVMAAGAGALDIRLGGAAIYHGRREERPTLGNGRPPQAADIDRSLALVRHGVLLWLALLWIAVLLQGILHA